ncbi:unnamed protein product [Allacma fusca]|uniref:Thioredoxin domain-containing protein n=1 Tax=Allacma fusca TaxID=39272 RepID=A0A8J2L200_9HEXA|nr:unnamed protein product [Allacma fusca]
MDSLDKSAIPHIKTEKELASTMTFAGDKLVVLDFYAKWCGPCQAISPIIENWVEEFPDVHFVKANVDRCESSLCDRYNVSSIPCFIFIKSGKVIDRFTGGRYPELKQLIITHSGGANTSNENQLVSQSEKRPSPPNVVKKNSSSVIQDSIDQGVSKLVPRKISKIQVPAQKQKKTISSNGKSAKPSQPLKKK